MNKNKLREGISLITLVITIVVIVILVGAIIISISNNNPIKQAQRATIRQDIAVMIEQHNLTYVTELGKVNGDEKKIQDAAFSEVVPSKYQADFKAVVEGIKYNCKDEMIKEIIKEMKTDKVILLCEMTKPTISDITVENITGTTAEMTLFAEAGAEGSTIVNYKYSIDNGITYKESGSNKITIEGLISGIETIVKVKVVDSNGNESSEKSVSITTKIEVEGITIPDGFYYVGGTKDTGVVISDNIADKDKGDSYEVAKTLLGNQYVWVPITSEVDFARRNWGKGYSLSDCTEPYANGYSTEIAEYNEMKVRVIENKGFYIARYEASKSGGKAESKALRMPWTSIKWSNADEMNTEPSSGTASYEGRHASNKLGYKSVQSTLIYGAQWDSALKFIENTGVNVKSSTSWGNHKDSTFDYITTSNATERKENSTSTLIPTGSTEYTKKQNISDMAGNTWEWSMEANLYTISRSIRGGAYHTDGGIISAASREEFRTSYSADNISFRVALYIK